MGLPFDADPVDRFTDGWVGFPLTGRFDQDVNSTVDAKHGMDSHVQPSTTYMGPDNVYKGPYTQTLNSLRMDLEVSAQTVLEGEFIHDGYTQGPIQGLRLDFDQAHGSLVAGQEYLAFVKYVDSNNMTNSTGAGDVTVVESDSLLETVVPVVGGGYQAYMLTPTVAGNVTWGLSDGTFVGSSDTREVVPGPFVGFKVSPLADLKVGEEYPVEIQAVDAWGNPVTDVGIYTKVTLNPENPLVVDSAVPSYVEMVNGYVQFNLKMQEPWLDVGRIKFSASSTISTYSTPFRVSL